MLPPRLESERLILQPMKAEDAGTLLTYRSHPEVARFQDWHAESVSETAQFIKGHDGFDFGIPDTWYQIGIYLKSTHTLISDMGIHFLNAKTKAVEIGYTIAPKHQRNGYAFESVSRMIEFLFIDFGASMIIAVTDHKNHPSMGLLARLKFKNISLEHLPFSLELLPEEVSYALSKTRWDSVTGAKRTSEYILMSE
jgi:RimJ/RimL family protein N-acetyltransferase